MNNHASEEPFDTIVIGGGLGRESLPRYGSQIADSGWRWWKPEGILVVASDRTGMRVRNSGWISASTSACDAVASFSGGSNDSTKTTIGMHNRLFTFMMPQANTFRRVVGIFPLLFT